LQTFYRKLRELTYAWEADSYVAPDMTILNEHLTKALWEEEGLGIIDMALQKEPQQIVWATRADGVFLSMIYERAEKVLGWHRHSTDGWVEAVEAIPGSKQTEVWFVVKRVVNGQVVKNIEMMEPLEHSQDQGAVCLLDSALTYNGALISNISGLDHLEGREVAVLADGCLHANKRVAAGEISLDYPASLVHVGLPYLAWMRLQRPEGGSQQGTAQGLNKRIHNVILRLLESWGGKIGPDEYSLEDIMERKPEEYGALPMLASGDVEKEFAGEYEDTGQMVIMQDLPLPLTVCGVVSRMTVNEG
jgi:hypothetical protein